MGESKNMAEWNRARNSDSSFFGSVYQIVEQIPFGKVISYGQIARMLGNPQAARQVGWAMRRCPDGLPWQRVIKEDGTVAGGMCSGIQIAMLEAEGVALISNGRVDMAACRWKPEP